MNKHVIYILRCNNVYSLVYRVKFVRHKLLLHVISPSCQMVNWWNVHISATTHFQLFYSDFYILNYSSLYLFTNNYIFLHFLWYSLTNVKLVFVYFLNHTHASVQPRKYVIFVWNLFSIFMHNTHMWFVGA
jgi:hypothetical protein